MKKLNYLAAIFCLLAIGTVQAQDSNTDSHTIGVSVPTVSLVDIEPAASKNITMNFTAPTEAGLPIAAPADNSSLWLNYSNIPSASGTPANVTVELDALIPGIDVNLTASADAGLGDGTMGTSVGTLTLTVGSQIIIQNVGASYTGDGANSGHQLTYSLDVVGGTSDYSALFANTNSVTVTYTISE